MILEIIQLIIVIFLAIININFLKELMKKNPILEMAYNIAQIMIEIIKFLLEIIMKSNIKNENCNNKLINNLIQN